MATPVRFALAGFGAWGQFHAASITGNPDAELVAITAPSDASRAAAAEAYPNARIFAEMGFDAWFFARLDHEDKDRRTRDNELEYVWMPNPKSLGKDVNIFTHVLFNHYEAPPGFNFEIDGNDPLFISNKKSKDFNAEERAQ